jgi:hypothetical protein
LNNLLKAIEGLKKKVENVPVMVEESCADIASKANSRAPIGVSVYANGNTVTASGPLAAYIEFGTGDAAAVYTQTLPEEWDNYAYSFFKTGKGKLLDSPYLFPAYESERLILIKKIKESFERR